MLKATIILFCSNAVFLMVTKAHHHRHQQQQPSNLPLLLLQKVPIMLTPAKVRMITIISLRKNAVNQCTSLKRKHKSVIQICSIC